MKKKKRKIVFKRRTKAETQALLEELEEIMLTQKSYPFDPDAELEKLKKKQKK
ncbi:MAG: hypothetical protein Q7S21_05440 [archaeon]|nr:hypothetical protein [archaeon]